MAPKRIWLLTGEPGSGKSTTLSRILLSVKTEGFTVGGILTREIRKRGEREGFLLVNLATEESRMLANISGILGPRIGKYKVDLNSLAGAGVAALEHARMSSDLIACDELGPMELLSPEFRREVSLAVLESTKPCICVVHKTYSDPLIEELKSSPYATEVEITFENRDSVTQDVQKDIIQFLTRLTREKK